MKRIGIAASKIAKGNLFLYNCFVILISFLFSLFVFTVVGATVVFALVIISYVGNEVLPGYFKDFRFILYVCMVVLTIITMIFNVWAIYRNIKVPRKKQ